MKFHSLPYLFSSLLLIMSCSDDVDPGLELLDNIELEEGFGKPVGWNFFVESFDQNSEFDFEWSRSRSLSGERSVMIYIDSENPDEFAAWTRTISFDSSEKVGSELELSAWLRGDMEGVGAILIIRGDRDGEIVNLETTQFDNPVTGVFNWKKIKVSTLVEEGIDSYSLFLLLSGSTLGEVYFDDVSLKLKLK